MDKQIRELINQLPESPVDLTEKNLRRIHELIPVPTDYKILWADILSFGGYPAGVVITEQGLVVKGTNEEVKAFNAKAKEDRKTKGGKAKTEKVTSIYRIIPWWLFNPADYSIEILNSNVEEKRYVLKIDGQDLAQLSSEPFYNLFTTYRNEIIEQQKLADRIIENSSFSAVNSAMLAPG